jgi:hypothetical protein
MKPPPLTEFGVERHTLVRQEDHIGSSSSYKFRLQQWRVPAQASAQIFQLQREVLGRIYQHSGVARPNQSGRAKSLQTHLRVDQGASSETDLTNF